MKYNIGEEVAVDFVGTITKIEKVKKFRNGEWTEVVVFWIETEKGYAVVEEANIFSIPKSEEDFKI